MPPLLSSRIHGLRGSVRLPWIWLIVLSILAFLIQAVLSESLANDSLMKSERGNLMQDLDFVCTLVTTDLQPELERRTDEMPRLTAMFSALFGRSSVRVTLIALDGTVVADNYTDASTMENHGRRPEFLAAIDGDPQIFQRSSATLHSDFLYVARKVGTIVVRASIPVSIPAQFIVEYRGRFLVVLAVSLLLLVSAWSYLYRKMLVPLNAILANVEAWRSGQEELLPMPKRPREFAALGRAFSHVFKELREEVRALEQRKEELSALFDVLREPVIVTNRHGIIYAANQGARELALRCGGVSGSQEIVGTQLLLWLRSSSLALAVEKVQLARDYTGYVDVRAERPLKFEVNAKIADLGTGEELVLLVFYANSETTQGLG